MDNWRSAITEDVVLFRSTHDYSSDRPAFKMVGAGGIEPPNDGIKIRCLTAWLRPNRPEEGYSCCFLPLQSDFRLSVYGLISC